MRILQVHGLTKSYGDKKVLDHFSFEVREGEIVGLIGKNGAGKTTLLNCIAGNIFPDSGSICYDNQDLLAAGGVRKDFGISIQPSFFDYLNTYDNLKLLQHTVGLWDKKEIKKRSDEVLKMVGLEGKGKKYVRSFSFGMKQRLGFAQALLNGNQFLILDEPFVGLDMNGRTLVKEHIQKIAKERQVGIIFSDHNLDEVRSLCQRVIVIRDGRKIHDKDLKEEKEYSIQTADISRELAAALSAIQGVEIHADKRQIRLKSDVSIHNVIATVILFTKIIDLKVSEQNLEKMLYGGVE